MSFSGDMALEGTFLTPTGLFLISMSIMYFVTAILHPQEFGRFKPLKPFVLFCVGLHYISVMLCFGYATLIFLSFYTSPCFLVLRVLYVIISPSGMIVYGLMYFICIPSGYLLLTIYSLVNMHIVSWGTRESNK